MEIGNTNQEVARKLDKEFVARVAMARKKWKNPYEMDTDKPSQFTRFFISLETLEYFDELWHDFYPLKQIADKEWILTETDSCNKLGCLKVVLIGEKMALKWQKSIIGQKQ